MEGRFFEPTSFHYDSEEERARASTVDINFHLDAGQTRTHSIQIHATVKILEKEVTTGDQKTEMKN